MEAPFVRPNRRILPRNIFAGDSTAVSDKDIFGNLSDSVSMIFPSSMMDTCEREDMEKTPLSLDRV
jgi:hypothetical protein